MKKNLHYIDELFKQALEHYNEEPSANIWSAVENDLNKRDVEKYKTKYYSLRRAFICTILTVISLSLGDVLQFTKNDSSKNEAENISSLNKITFPTDHPDVIKINALVNKTINEGDAKAGRKRVANDNIFYDDFLNVQQENKTSLFSSHELIADVAKINSNITIQHALLKKNIPINPTQDHLAVRYDENKINKKHSFSIIPFGSLDHISQRLLEQYQFNNEDESDFTRREKPDMSYTVGLLFEYGLTKRLSLQSGLSMSNSFTSVSPTIVRAVKDNSGAYRFKLATTYGLAEIKKTGISTPQIGDSILLNDATVHVRYFSIPMLMKINLKPGKLNINATTGIAINRINSDKVEVDYRTTTVNEIETVEKIEGLKNTFFTVIFGAQASYHINNSISVGIDPVIRYAVTPVNKGTPVKTYPVSIGIGASAHIKL